MKLTFRLRFHTHPGQSLFLLGNHNALGGGKIENAVPLHYRDFESWQTTIDIPVNQGAAELISYSYLLKNSDGSVVQDWGQNRSVDLTRYPAKELLVIDSWNDAGTIENVFYTEPFKNTLLHRAALTKKNSSSGNGNLELRIKAPLLAKNEIVCALGNWNTTRAVLLTKNDPDDFWNASIDLRNAHSAVQYKYGIWNTAENGFIRFEDGDNRTIQQEAGGDFHTIVDDGFIRLPAQPWKGAGVAIPVFSLRTNEGFGVGEFSDIKKLVDWCRHVGLRLIQLLPINDTNASDTWRDSYPYAAISAFALHPIYLRIDGLDNGGALSKELQSERQRLNALEALDYEAVFRAKIKFVCSIFKEQKKALFMRPDYQAYFSENKYWLVPYAAFCALRDKNQTSNFQSWPTHQTYNANEIASLKKKDSAFAEEMELNYFVQFHLHLQLKEATEYAHSHGIIIKGDIAIGVHRHGADVWQQPELYYVDKQAGAPPDPFDAKGQNWGFPTYNWPRMMQDGLLWWKQRFSQMSLYFDAFRVDHILGFFRIWSNPADAIEGILGSFVPALPVKRTEFLERGLPFDADRLLKPFIDATTLHDLFGSEEARVKKEFLTAVQGGLWNLKPEFASQLLIEERFARMESTAQNKKIRLGLFDLITNVILLETTKGNREEFHFRFGMMDTTSFKNFDSQTQAKLQHLYIDYFFRRQETLWKQQGLEKLPALKRATNMLICGEDLGMVPDCVPEVMKQLGLLSLEIQRMPKTMHAAFSRPADAPYLSVVTLSTHDMSTIRGWWEEDKKVTQKFFHEELKLSGPAPENCDAGIVTRVIEQHLASPALWSIFQLQDLLGMNADIRREKIDDERINVPANTKNYWRYRMHLTLETLQKASAFNESLKFLIASNNR